jgi:hypothetical protein
MKNAVTFFLIRKLGIHALSVTMSQELGRQLDVSKLQTDPET